MLVDHLALWARAVQAARAVPVPPQTARQVQTISMIRQTTMIPVVIRAPAVAPPVQADLPAFEVHQAPTVLHALVTLREFAASEVLALLAVVAAGSMLGKKKWLLPDGFACNI